MVPQSQMPDLSISLHSGARFRRPASDTTSCVVFDLNVALGEVVAIGAVSPVGRYLEQSFSVGGHQRICDDVGVVAGR